eukprot:GHVU01133262.1.p1 GENE.GHVU01133262.1~~GHVU01133262.1.p1  ORF type:complete len:160 (-),score=15.09 GHVU01133262.1:200-679(-)
MHRASIFCPYSFFSYLFLSAQKNGARGGKVAGHDSARLFCLLVVCLVFVAFAQAVEKKKKEDCREKMRATVFDQVTIAEKIVAEEVCLICVCFVFAAQVGLEEFEMRKGNSKLEEQECRVSRVYSSGSEVDWCLCVCLCLLPQVQPKARRPHWRSLRPG